MIQLPLLKTFEEINFQGIIDEFKQPLKGEYKLPRIAFIGYFRHLSMTTQRDICKYLSFEYYKNIEMATTDKGKMSILVTKWNDITKGFTRLIVIGKSYYKMPEWQFKMLLYKQYKKDSSSINSKYDIPCRMESIVFKYNIPCIMEEELWKIHQDYPDINNNKRWDSKFMKHSLDIEPYKIKQEL